MNGSRRHRNSGGSAAEEESLSRSASDSSVTNPTLNHNKQSAPGTPQLNHGWVLVRFNFFVLTFMFVYIKALLLLFLNDSIIRMCKKICKANFGKGELRLLKVELTEYR